MAFGDRKAATQLRVQQEQVLTVPFDAHNSDGAAALLRPPCTGVPPGVLASRAAVPAAVAPAAAVPAAAGAAAAASARQLGVVRCCAAAAAVSAIAGRRRVPTGATRRYMAAGFSCVMLRASSTTFISCCKCSALAKGRGKDVMARSGNPSVELIALEHLTWTGHAGHHQLV